jgi:hypothetical protein
MLDSITMIHPTLHMSRQMLLPPSRAIISIKTPGESPNPFIHFVDVVIASLLRNYILDDCVAVSEEVISPIVVPFGGVDCGGRRD